MTSEYDDLLYEFEALPQISMSIFDIAGYPHYENVCSNILAFYLDPNNEHGLGKLLYLCLMSLLQNSAGSEIFFAGRGKGIGESRDKSTLCCIMEVRSPHDERR